MLHGNKAVQALRALPPIKHTTPLLAMHQQCVQTQAQSFFLVGQVFASLRAADQAEQAFQKCADLSSLAGTLGYKASPPYSPCLFFWSCTFIYVCLATMVSMFVCWAVAAHPMLYVSASHALLQMAPLTDDTTRQSVTTLLDKSLKFLGPSAAPTRALQYLAAKCFESVALAQTTAMPLPSQHTDL
jgi:hypothetical protein